jgi:hypothetical protein
MADYDLDKAIRSYCDAISRNCTMGKRLPWRSISSLSQSRRIKTWQRIRSK